LNADAVAGCRAKNQRFNRNASLQSAVRVQVVREHVHQRVRIGDLINSWSVHAAARIVSDAAWIRQSGGSEHVRHFEGATGRNCRCRASIRRRTWRWYGRAAGERLDLRLTQRDEVILLVLIAADQSPISVLEPGGI